MADEQLLLRTVLRRDFLSFCHKAFLTTAPGQRYIPNWHHEVIAYHLQEVAAGRLKRLVINVAPRSLKSHMVSAALPAWLLGHDPTNRIICASYSDELARTFSRQSRLIMESDWYRWAFPATVLDPRKNTEGEFATTAQGQRLATSVGGTLTGRGGRVLIVDDPLKGTDAGSEAARRRAAEWLTGTLMSRLDDKNTGAIILVMQRLHEEDPSGHLLTPGGGYTHVSIPAIAVEDECWQIGMGKTHVRRAGEPLHDDRESVATLETMRRQLGSMVFSAQYQQMPVPPEGNLFRRSWLERYTKRPEIGPKARLIHSWDVASSTAEKADYSVCSVWKLEDGHRYTLLEIVRGRWAYPDLLRQARALAEMYPPERILIEEVNAGMALLQSLNEERVLNVIGITPAIPKRERAMKATAEFETGRVLLPENAAWLADLERELLAFPYGRHDDQVDSIVQFLLWAAQERSYPPVPLVSPVFLPNPNSIWRKFGRNW